MTAIKGTAKLKKIMFPKGSSMTNGGFTIASFEPDQMEEGEIEVNDRFGTFTIKGEMPPLKEGSEYYFVVEEGERHPTFGMSYDLTFMRQNVDLDTADEKSVKKFLEIILTKRQIGSLYKAFENPLEVIESKDIKRLTEAHGVGPKVAQRIIDHYESQKDYSHAYMELGQFDLQPTTIKKVVDFYGSPELAVTKVKENPFELMKIDGYGFKSCDKIFFQMGGDPNSEIRIKSFLLYALQEEANKGHTWMSPLDLINATAEYIPNADRKLIGTIMVGNPDVFSLSDDKMRISLTMYKKLEGLVSDELCRLLSAENTFNYEGWQDRVKEVEDGQGWSFTEQQKEAMLMMLENNVSILQGYGGTGKTTTLKAVADILEDNGYLYAQCALSGKASNNLAIVTGKEGSTIHRLLAFSPMEGGFYYNKNRPLPYDIIIVDELSMIDARLFGHLLLAIRTGAKLIMLGDSEQLESIGVPVMVPMIQSKVIPTMTLTQIHRQAQKSAVVTDSIAIRQGKQVVKERTGRVVHGELEDLEYELLEDDTDIPINVMREFNKYIKTEDIMDIQILTQTREKGKVSCLVLNRACQRVYNPPSETKKEVKLGNESKGTDYILREGDKVINVKNNYRSVDEYGNECPVFNGNIGMIERFDEDEDGKQFMIVNFEGIGKVVIEADSYKSIELAYSITVHKSQGSSSKIIMIALPFHYTLNTRQLFYTAITRTREHCVIFGSLKTIRSCIKKDEVSKKRTFLADYLKGKNTKQNH
ncbi:AAA family ATPase (plasmid) [Bacillus velezensis]|uniref:AAA family ATPase n=1 Tax=Bacillus velezensis TaxID=492670 RepID=UPI0004A096C1|nr:AAA family ATPase [Bacillus velezensis]KDN91286.1 RecD/TraA family helicase [Bacillus amyloliquefaciens]URJ76391.1 AAA family ATPase [Bacillus velezensis]URJ80347.1 AAA family ATPase [Bacillus velezensis]